MDSALLANQLIAAALLGIITVIKSIPPKLYGFLFVIFCIEQLTSKRKLR